MERYKLKKNNPNDVIWWVDNANDVKGEWLFTFDKKVFFNMFRDYPDKLTEEQREIFARENPYWADFFQDRPFHPYSIGVDDFDNIKEYLRFFNIKTIDDMTDEQVLDWARAGKMGVKTQVAVGIVEHGECGRMPDKKKAVKLLKQAIKENKEFVCTYIMHESCNGRQDIPKEYFGMEIV